MMDPTIPKREVLYEFQDDIILKDQIVQHREDKVEREKDHDIAHGQQRSEGFINTDDIFSHPIYLMTETDEIKKPEADIPQSQRNRVTTASENEQNEEESLKNHELSVTSDEQAIEPGVHEAKNVDDPKQGAKTRKKDPTVPDRETLYVLQDDATLNNLVLPNEVDIIRKDEDHKEARDHHRSDGLVNSNDSFNPAKYVVAKITKTKGDHIAGTSQTHWDVVEV